MVVRPARTAFIRAIETTRVGTIVFPNSGAATAQPFFLRGVALLHSFSYDRAREAFREAERLDPDFALAYWGEALSDRQSLGGQEDTLAARAALGRLAPTPAARAAKAKTARERAYLAAVEKLVGSDGLSDDSKVSGKAGFRLRIDSLRIARYAESMRQLYTASRNDDEAAAFYAHALLNRRALEDNDPDQWLRTSIAVAAALEGVFSRNPDHPGAAHFLIHAYDDSRLAPLGLRAANAYAAIAPNEEHAQHMPSHIFMRFGQWDGVVRSNERAWDLTRAAAAGIGPDARLGYDWHYADFLQYAYLQEGRWRDAKKLADSARALLGTDALDRMKPIDRQNLVGFLKGIVDRYPRETEQYPPVSLDEGLDPIDTYLRRNVSLLDSLEARLKIAPASVMTEESRQAQLRQTRVFAAALAGRPDSAIVMFQRWCKSDLKDPQRAATEGGRSWGETVCELAGDLLLQKGSNSEAVTAFDDALVDVPGHWIARLGRARALTCLGDAASARSAYAELLAQWAHADPDLPALAEVKAGAVGAKVGNQPRCGMGASR